MNNNIIMYRLCLIVVLKLDSFIQNALNMMILYASSWSNYVCVPTSIGHSNSVGKGKNSLLLDDLL